MSNFFSKNTKNWVCCWQLRRQRPEGCWPRRHRWQQAGRPLGQDRHPPSRKLNCCPGASLFSGGNLGAFFHTLYLYLNRLIECLQLNPSVYHFAARILFTYYLVLSVLVEVFLVVLTYCLHDSYSSDKSIDSAFPRTNFWALVELISLPKSENDIEGAVANCFFLSLFYGDSYLFISALHRFCCAASFRFSLPRPSAVSSSSSKNGPRKGPVWFLGSVSTKPFRPFCAVKLCRNPNTLKLATSILRISV